MDETQLENIATDIAEIFLQILKIKESGKSVPRELSDSLIMHLNALSIQENNENKITNVKLELGLNNDSATNDFISLNHDGGIITENLLLSIVDCVKCLGISLIVVKTITKVLEMKRGITVEAGAGAGKLLSVVIPPLAE